MNAKTRNIIGWVLTALIAALFLFSAFGKFSGSEDVLKGAATMGLTANDMKMIGAVELLAIILFIIPRTGLLGTLLLAAYLGGAIATHVEHAMSFVAPAIIQAIVWITATIRFPELSRRLMGNPNP